MSGFFVLAVMTVRVYTSENAGENMSTPIRSIRLDDKRWDSLKYLGMDWLKQQIDRAIKKDQRKPTAKLIEE